MFSDNLFLTKLREPMIALIRDSFDGFNIEVKEEMNQNDLVVILEKQGKHSPSKTYVSISFIRHRQSAATSLVRVSRELQDEYQTIYQMPYKSTCVILVSGEYSDEIAFGIHLRMKISSNARSSFLSHNLAISDLGEVTDTDIEEADTSFLKRRRFLVTVNHVVQFVEKSNYVKRVEIINTKEPQDIIIVQKQDELDNESI